MEMTLAFTYLKKFGPCFFLNCDKRLDLKAKNINFVIGTQYKTVKVQDVVAYACSKNIIFGDNQTVIKHFPV